MRKSIPWGIDVDERVIRIYTFYCKFCQHKNVNYGNFKSREKLECGYCGKVYDANAKDAKTSKA